MRILLLGANGQIGTALSSRLGGFGNVYAAGRDECDLANAQQVIEKLQNHRPDVIINSAAYTSVENAEKQPVLAHAINGGALRSIANWAQSNNSLLLHYSTDYVFDGTKKGPYSESDEPNPLSVYGRSKLAGDQAIKMAQCRHLIFRTSWVYGDMGHNFARNILTLAQKRERLAIVRDQIGSPTHANLIADATLHCLERYLKANANEKNLLVGLYHLAAKNVTSWYGFARYLIEGARRNGAGPLCHPNNISSIQTEDSTNHVIRPLNSELSCDKIKKNFNVCLPDWRKHADAFLLNWKMAQTNET